jgi:hypothetical protein
VVNFKHRWLDHRRNSSGNALTSRLGGTQVWSGRFEEYLSFVPLSGIENWEAVTSLLTACEQDRDGTGFQFYPEQTCMTYTIAVCTVKNLRRWIKKLSETCTVSFQEQIWGIRASSWFYYKKFNKLHGHMNIKFEEEVICGLDIFG